MKKIQSKLIQGTLLLTIAGFITRIIGFAYRIFLADILNSHLLGIYQLIFPVYGICFTIYGAGIQTAISQLIAGNVAPHKNKKTCDLYILKLGLFLSLTFSFSLSFIVFFYAKPIATYLILEPACQPYIQILAILFPPCGISACINGYFYGKKEAKVPAITQIIEQLIRVLFVVLISMFFSLTGSHACKLAVFGLVFGETGSCIYNCFQLYLDFKHIKTDSNLLHTKSFSKHKTLKNLLALAFTLTSTKLILSLLHSVEAIFIPAALKKFGCSASEALSIYGILSGIAFPFILFPSTVTNSFAVMLLPAISQSHAQKDEKKITFYVSTSCKCSLLIGYFFSAIFLLFGNEFGLCFFHNETAGIYIVLLSWLCPFLYLSTTFTSIINGLGQTQFTFFVTIISLSVKIYFLIALVPHYGIKAYLVGSLISQIIMTVIEAFYLKKYISVSTFSFLFIPVITLIIAGGTIKYIFTQLTMMNAALSANIMLISACMFLTAIYLFTLKITGCLSFLYPIKNK